MKSLIECFNPILRGSPDIIYQQMLTCSESWKNKEDIYIGAINYIEHGRKEVRNKKEQLKDIEIERLREILIREIENRMPKHCKRCDEWYIVKLTDRPEIHCMWCRVGMHDCMEINEIAMSPGFKWLCDRCEPIFTEHLLPKMDRAASFDGFSIDMRMKNVNHVLGKKHETITAKKQKSNTRKEEDKDLDVIHVEEMEDVRKIDNNDKNENRDKKQTESNKREAKETCWFWKNRNCKFLNNCKKEHPERCREMIETGLCKNSRCTLIHPKICRKLFYTGYCDRGNLCWFVHPTKCNNKPQTNITHTNSHGGSNQRMATQHPNSNHNMNSFLHQWPQRGIGMGLRSTQNNNNNAWRERESQGMMQMMQNMMQKIVRMDNKIESIETGGMYFNGI